MEYIVMVKEVPPYPSMAPGGDRTEHFAALKVLNEEQRKPLYAILEGLKSIDPNLSYEPLTDLIPAVVVTASDAVIEELTKNQGLVVEKNGTKTTC